MSPCLKHVILLPLPTITTIDTSSTFDIREFLQPTFYFYFDLTWREKVASLVLYKVIILVVLLFHCHQNTFPWVPSPKFEAHRQPYCAETLAIIHDDGSTHKQKRFILLAYQEIQGCCSIVQAHHHNMRLLVLLYSSCCYFHPIWASMIRFWTPL